VLTSSTCSKPVEIRLAASWRLQTWCKLMKQVAWSLQISTCSKHDRTTCSKSDERINVDASWENQTCCKLFKQFAASVWITSLDKSDKQLAASLLRSGLLQLDICRLSASW
jgi:hypothetical protein